MWKNKMSAALAAKEAYAGEDIPFMEGDMLIEADNLKALQALQKSYTSRVDVIYIDPPYNTKNHKFDYRDDFRKSGEDSHARWLDFIYPRLLLACELLRNDGVVFISIDEVEAAHLRLLCDEIFGEENFIAQLVWQKKSKASYLHKKVARVCEYILCYAKDAAKVEPLRSKSRVQRRSYPLTSRYNPRRIVTFPAKSVSFALKSSVIKAGDYSDKSLYCRLLDDITIKDSQNERSFRIDSSWRYGEPFMSELFASDAQIRIAKLPIRPTFIKDVSHAKMLSNLLLKSQGVPTYEDASKKMVEEFGYELFRSPKPVALLRLLLDSVSHAKKRLLVLDIFAGSGTTFEAAMESACENKIEIETILIQSSEALSKNSEAYRRGERTIYEIFEKRVESVCRKYGRNFE
ncbi:MAG: site-specific DNA-methyltransferase, partial [Epsilonproteobacteria bacterium]|nr:site-specific DNA-methyltransferase [Campylobacterota bacterium]